MAAGSPHAQTPWQRLRAVLAPERRELWVLLVYGVGVGLLSLGVPAASQALVNAAGFGSLVQPVVLLALVVLGTLAFSALLRALQVVVVELLQQRLYARMAIELASRLPRLRLEVHDTHRGTELVNRFFDVMTLQKGTALILLDGLALVLQAALGLLLLAFYSPLLLGFDVLLLGAMALVLFGLGRRAVRTSITESYAKYATVAWLEELARAPTVFKHSHGAALALQRADALTTAYLEARQRHFRLLLHQVVGTLVVQTLASALLLGLGGWLVLRRQLTLGQLVAAELVVTPVVSTFAKLGKYLETLYDVLAGVDKVGTLFDLPLEPPAATPLPPPPAGPAALRLVDVAFAFPGREPSLRGVDLEVAPGSRVAILGPEGSGKSTLLEVAVGLRTPGRGAVELDGVDVRELPPGQLREGLGLVRGVELFDGTVLDNVRVGRALDAHAVREALAAVGLRDVVARLPQGLSTPVSGAGTPLSSGQAQRLVLARALAGRPRLLVLDETLDTLDAKVRAQMMDTLFSPGAPWTLLLTTRLPEMAARCDRVLLLEEGRLREARPP